MKASEWFEHNDMLPREIKRQQRIQKRLSARQFYDTEYSEDSSVGKEDSHLVSKSIAIVVLCVGGFLINPIFGLIGIFISIFFLR